MKSSDNSDNFCKKCHKENCICNDEPKKIKDNTDSKYSKSSNKKNFTNTKFLHAESGEMLCVEDLIKRLEICDSQTSDKNEIKGKCKYCHRIVDNPTTKHLHVTHFKASECDEFCTDCLNCNMQNVKIKQHFLNCPMKPKECTLRSLGCKGLLITNQLVCTLANNHDDLIKKRIRTILDKISSYHNENLEVKQVTKEIDGIIENLNELKDGLLEFRKRIQIPRNGKLILRIDNAFDFLEKEKPQISTAVYTNEFGYKLCLKIYPKGDGIGLNNYFSIFFVVMKGEYDDLLSWPFDSRVRIKLHNSIISRSKYEIYKPNNSEAFHKPIKKFNLASGNPKFISIKELKESGFIIDDSLFIELNMEQTKTWL